jgi:hypothetical protein
MFVKDVVPTFAVQLGDATFQHDTPIMRQSAAAPIVCDHEKLLELAFLKPAPADT